MPTPKQPDQAVPKSALKVPDERKPWKKKTPAEVVLDQISRVRADVTKKEEELKEARRQLQKLEEVRKVLEGN